MSNEFTFNIQFPQTLKHRTPENKEQEMLYQAIAFFQAGSRCEADFKLTPNVTNSLSAPAIVCYAFAIEIYLKLLSQMAQVEIKRKHTLSILFNTLPRNYIEIIVKHYNLSEAELRKAISDVSNAFVEWRYLYEQDGAIMSTKILSNICVCLHQAVREIKPNLKVMFENQTVIP
jgi:capsule polysaccharide modification protein KpsS